MVKNFKTVKLFNLVKNVKDVQSIKIYFFYFSLVLLFANTKRLSVSRKRDFKLPKRYRQCNTMYRLYFFRWLRIDWYNIYELNFFIKDLYFKEYIFKKRRKKTRKKKIVRVSQLIHTRSFDQHYSWSYRHHRKCAAITGQNLPICMPTTLHHHKFEEFFLQLWKRKLLFRMS